MLTSSLPLLLVVGVTGVSAFPALSGMKLSDLPKIAVDTLKLDLLKRTVPVANVTGLVRVPDAAHPFMAPGPTDQRGPCPGLNTLANHGYLPRNGIVSQADIIAATGEGFNMSPDLAAVLYIIGAAYEGDPTTGLISIGGSDNRTSLGLGLVQNLIGSAGGLDYHAGIEGDASATRNDLYFGDNHSFQPSLYAQMKSSAAKYGGLYTPDAMGEHARNRYLNSIATNPEFYFVPTTAPLGIGAKVLVTQLFSNGTYGLGGVPNEASISAFFGAQTLANGTIVHVPERFPDNWYRRGTPYTTVEVVTAQVAMQAQQGLVFGANAGKTNSFVPLSIGATTNVDGMGCLIRDAVQANIPSIAGKVAAGAAGIAATIVGQLDPYFAPFNCPAYNPAEAAAYAAVSKWVTYGE